MESKSSNNSRNRQGGQRSGGGNRGGRNRGNSNQNRNRNRNRNRDNNYQRGRRRRPEPKPTTAQKILSFLTFGLLGKPKHKSQKRRKSNDTSPRGSQKPASTPAKPRQKRQKPEITTARLYVGNLSFDAHEGDLEELFNGAGNVVSAEVVTNARTQQSKGFAFVEMGSVAEAKRAVDILDDEDFMGRRLRINSAKSEGPRESSFDNDDRKQDDEVTPPVKEEAPAVSESETTTAEATEEASETTDETPTAIEETPEPIVEEVAEPEAAVAEEPEAEAAEESETTAPEEDAPSAEDSGSEEEKETAPASE